jgi:ABC-type antimicrobial peptide transport system ATPase subunit
MNQSRNKRMLIEEATTAWRPRTPEGTILQHPAWADLDPESRGAAFEETVASRRLERGLDPDGYSTTVRAVLSRLSP